MFSQSGPCCQGGQDAAVIPAKAGTHTGSTGGDVTGPLT